MVQKPLGRAQNRRCSSRYSRRAIKPYLGGGNGHSLQVPSLRIPTGRGAWWCTDRGVAESDTTELLSTQVALLVKILPARQCWRQKRCRFDPWVWKIPWRRTWQPTAAFLPAHPMDRGASLATVHGVPTDLARMHTSLLPSVLTPMLSCWGWQEKHDEPSVCYTEWSMSEREK